MKLVRVRVLPERTISLNSGVNESTSYAPGDELDLPAKEAVELVGQGFVEKLK